MPFSSAATFVAHVDALVAKHGAYSAQVGAGHHIYREYSVKVRGDAVDPLRVHIAFFIAQTTAAFLDDLVQLAGDDEEAVREFFLTNIGPHTSAFSIGYNPEGIEAYIEVSPPPGPGAACRIVAYDSGKRKHSTYHEIRGRKPIAAVYDQYRALVAPEVYRALVALVPPTACLNVYRHEHPDLAASCQFAPAAKLHVHATLDRLARLFHAAGASPAALAVLDDAPPSAIVTWIGLYVPADPVAKLVVKVYYV